LRKGSLISAAAAALAIGLVGPATAGAAISSTVTGTTATITSDAGGGDLRIVTAGANVSHIQVPTGFNSQIDWDSTQPDDQTLPNAPGTSVIYNGGSGADSLTVGGNGAPASGILADITMHGGGGSSDEEVVQDSSDVTSRNWSITAGQVAGLGPGLRAYDGIESLEAESGTGNDVATVGSTAPTTSTSAITNGGIDQIFIADGVNLNDGTADGGDGDDLLSFRDWTAPVDANLETNDLFTGATPIGTVRNIEGLQGGTQGDTLTGDDGTNLFFGGDGDDTLTGNGGHDVLTGDKGTDTVDGGPGDDTLQWSVGDGTETEQAGGDPGDLASFFGTNGADTFTYGPGVTGASVSDGTDTVSLGGVKSLNINGNTNPANLSQPDGNDTMTGAPGLAGVLRTTLNGGPGNDHLTSGDERSDLDGGPGDDALDGGGGTDTADFSAPVTADLAAGTATGEGSDTLTNIENLGGSSGPDTLLGDGGANKLEGFEGNDLIDARDGQDLEVGDAGDDDIRSRDGFADQIACGDGNDTVTADLLDLFEPGTCENILLPSTTNGGSSSGGNSTTGTTSSTSSSSPSPQPIISPPPPPPAGNPATGVTLSGSATVAPNGTAIIGTITNPPTASAAAVLSGVLPAKLAAPARSKPKAKPVTVAAGQTTAGAGATTKLAVKLGAKARSALKKHSLRVTATVTARGADGTTATVTKAITLKRGQAPKRKKR
jgi:Ca2+-binding RTX toxin-like protein